MGLVGQGFWHAECCSRDFQKSVFMLFLTYQWIEQSYWPSWYVVEHKSVDTAEYKIDYYSGKTYCPSF